MSNSKTCASRHQRLAVGRNPTLFKDTTTLGPESLIDPPDFPRPSRRGGRLVPTASLQRAHDQDVPGTADRRCVMRTRLKGRKGWEGVSSKCCNASTMRPYSFALFGLAILKGMHVSNQFRSSLTRQADLGRVCALINPIIPGWNPDPSFIRVGSDYFIATSTFETWPGHPIYHSTDLVAWELIGHALNRQSQLALFGTSPGAGRSSVHLKYPLCLTGDTYRRLGPGFTLSRWRLLPDVDDQIRLHKYALSVD